jgi:hypothetical protein
MTPKEKAKDLVCKMYLKIPSVYDPTNLPNYPIAKEMALIAVDEILKEHFGDDSEYGTRRYYYFKEVKQEIELL